MSGDNMHDPQPDIRYAVNVHHHEEWEKMTFEERMKAFLPSLKKWESEYLKNNKEKLSEQQIELLKGRPIRSYEGMVYGQMYIHWKKQKGVNW